VEVSFAVVELLMRAWAVSFEIVWCLYVCVLGALRCHGCGVAGADGGLSMG
jgi:hypothetical protein